jgi:hypothetical protein
MKQIKTIEQINKLACEHKSVIVPDFFETSKPAAIFLYMTVGVVLKYLHSGMFVYEKEGKK